MMPQYQCYLDAVESNVIPRSGSFGVFLETTNEPVRTLDTAWFYVGYGRKRYQHLAVEVKRHQGNRIVLWVRPPDGDTFMEKGDSAACCTPGRFVISGLTKAQMRKKAHKYFDRRIKKYESQTHEPQS